jgi:RNA recognition motif-containing protein
MYTTNDSIAAVQLIFSFFISDIRQISACLMERFDVQRVVYLNKSLKEKNLFKGAVVLFNSDKNLLELSAPFYLIGDLVMSVVHISFEDAEDLIDQKKTKLYVGNIPYPVDNHALWNHFAQYGQLDYSYVLKSPEKKGAKGFGFVTYQHRDAAKQALNIEHIIDGNVLQCDLFNSKGKRKPQVGGSVLTENSLQSHKSSIKNDINSIKTEYALTHSSKDPSIKDQSTSRKIRGRLAICSSQPIASKSIINNIADPMFPHIGIDSEMPAIVMNEHIEQHFNQDQYTTDEPEYLEYLILKKEREGNLNNVQEEQSGGCCSSKKIPESSCKSQQNITLCSTKATGMAGDTKKSIDNDLCCCVEDECEDCNCAEGGCEDCWCDMVDDKYFCPPCCLCDYKPDPKKFLAINELLQQSNKRLGKFTEAVEVDCIPHQPCARDKISECEPCSKYLRIKKDRIRPSTTSCNQQGYKLFQ